MARLAIVGPAAAVPLPGAIAAAALLLAGLARGMPLTARLRALKAAPYAERDAASHKGKKVHKLADALMHGRQVKVPEALAGHVDACVKFLNEFEPQPVLTEALVYSLRHGYAGRLDAIVDMRRRLVDPRGADTTTRQLLDYKTGKAIYADVSPQLTAYAYADHYLGDGGKPEPMIAVDGGLAVHLRADGYDVYPVEISPRVFRLWQYAQQVAAWMGTWDRDERRPTGWCNEVIGAALPRPIRRTET